MLDRSWRVVLAILVTAGCAYTAPVPTTPVVVKPETAARLEVLVISIEDPKSSTVPLVSSAMNAIVAELRQAGFPISMNPKATCPVTVKVNGSRHSMDATFEANGAVIDRIHAYADASWDEGSLREFGRHVRQRLERSEALASLAAEQAAKPAPRSDGHPWLKTASATSTTRRLAVLEFRGALAPDLLAILSDQARSAAVERVRASGVAVLTRENTALIIKEQGKDVAQCTEGECEVETARLIGADLVVTGEVARIGPAKFLTMKLFDSRSGSLLSSKQADATDDLALVKAAKVTAAALFE